MPLGMFFFVPVRVEKLTAASRYFQELGGNKMASVRFAIMEHDILNCLSCFIMFLTKIFTNIAMRINSSCIR